MALLTIIAFSIKKIFFVVCFGPFSNKIYLPHNASPIESITYWYIRHHYSFHYNQYNSHYNHKINYILNEKMQVYAMGELWVGFL